MSFQAQDVDTNINSIKEKIVYTTYDMIRQVTPVMRFRDHIGPSSDTFTAVPGSSIFIYMYGEMKYIGFSNSGDT